MKSTSIQVVLLATLLLGAGAVAPAQAETTARREVSLQVAVRNGDQAGDTSRSEKIDQFIEQSLSEAGQSPNSIVDDETFLRRAYLDIVGRIPTIVEARQFLSSTQRDKRELLVHRLIESPGYVHHQFSFWADLLRAKSDMEKQGLPPAFYTAWIKESLLENTPYDQWVREMLTAKGYAWSNPATGYFQRDQGMPLDNMANTVQVFLGTSLQCAQCHDHPLDVWTRLDFYRMAANTYHLSTVKFDGAQWTEMKRILAEREASKEVRSWASRTFAMLKRKVFDAERELRLPEDYVGNDAQPGQVVQPRTIFGAVSHDDRSGDLQQDYAEWLTSTENPRFTKVIANRMWKKVMGHALIEPVDSLTDDSTASHPELLAYLEAVMKDVGYDLRKFQEILYKTKMYQRAVSTQDWVGEEPYLFPGPLLKQMTAEQLWDSFVTLMAPNIDLRQSKEYQQLPYLRANLIAYESATPAELVEASYQAEKVRRLHNETDEKTFLLNKRITAAEQAGHVDRVNELKSDLARLEHFRDHEIPMRHDGTNWLYKSLDEYRTAMGLPGDQLEDDAVGYWDRPETHWCVRASELASPEDPQHPLRVFGQSDREQVDNASSGPAVPMVLTLLNGEFFNSISQLESVAMQNTLAAHSLTDKVESLYLTLLSRPPTEDEVTLMMQELERAEDTNVVVKDIIWALINTREFLFIR